MRSSKKKTKKYLVIALIAAIAAVQLAIFFVVKSSDSDDEKKTETAENKTEGSGPLAQANSATPLPDPGSPTEDPKPLEIVDPPKAEIDEGSKDQNNAQEAKTPTPTEETAEAALTEPDPIAPSKRHEVPEKLSRRERARLKQEAAKEARAKREEAKVRAAKAKAESVTTPTPDLVKGLLSITTTPSGAKIALDGVFVGTTPMRNVEVSAGRHSVALSLAGFEPKVSSVTISPGKSEKVVKKLTKAAIPVVAAAPPAKAPVVVVAKRAPRTPRVSTSTEGNASAGAGVLGATCNGCHRKSGASRVGPRRFTGSQWDRFFSRGSHDRYERIGGKISSSQMANVKSYLKSKAADSARNQGAGIR